MCIGKVPRLVSWDETLDECEPKIGSPTKLGDSDWEEGARESLATEVTGHIAGNVFGNGSCCNCCWDGVKGMMEGAAGSTDGLGRKR